MSSVGRSNRFTKASPCPVCGGCEGDPRGQGKRCSGFASDDGAWVRCTREEHAGGLPIDDRASPPAYRHLMRGNCNCGVQHGPPDYTSEIEATYDYVDEAGKLLYQVVRKRPKRFLQRRPGATPDTWEWNLRGVRLVPYRLHLLLSADKLLPVYIVEGEKDVLSLESRGLVATTNAGGAGKWRSIQTSAAIALRGREVVVIADADEPGRKHARAVAAALQGVASRVTLLEPPPGHKDMSDAIRAGLGVQDCVPLAASPVALVTTASAMAWEDSEHAAPADSRIANDERPEVRLYATDTSKNVDALDAALAEHAPDVFQRGLHLVEVVSETRPRLSPEGAPVLRELNAHSLELHVSRNLNCVRFQPPDAAAIKLESTGGPRAAGEWVPTKAHKETAILPMLAHGRWRRIRPIVGVTESPMLRPDGTVLQVAGYDDGTGYLYRPPCEYPTVADHPTQDDARGALADLRHVFCDFPYISDPCSVVPIAALLTILSRPAIDGIVPVFAFEASKQNAGKTLQGDAVHMIATGRIGAHASFPADEQEQPKTVFSIALSGAPVAFFDNVKGIFGGAALECAITSSELSQRILGAPSGATPPWRAVVMVTGNNMTMTEDMLRRSLVSRVEPPEARAAPFAHHPLLDWVKEHRARLVAAALTLLRAYTAKGCPATGLAPLDSFESWSRLVPAAIAYAGGPNVIEAVGSVEMSGTDEAGAFAIFVRQLSRMGEVSTKGIIDRCYPAPRHDEPPDGWEEMREAIETMAPPKGNFAPSVKLLGMAVHSRVGQFHAGLKLISRLQAGKRLWSTASASK